MAIVYKVVQLEVGQSYLKLRNTTTDEHHIVSIIPFAVGDMRMGQELVVDMGGQQEGADGVLCLRDKQVCGGATISAAITGATTPNIKLDAYTSISVDMNAAPDGTKECRKLIKFIWDGSLWLEQHRSTIVS